MFDGKPPTPEQLAWAREVDKRMADATAAMYRPQEAVAARIRKGDEAAIDYFITVAYTDHQFMLKNERNSDGIDASYNRIKGLFDCLDEHAKVNAIRELLHRLPPKAVKPLP